MLAPPLQMEMCTCSMFMCFRVASKRTKRLCALTLINFIVFNGFAVNISLCIHLCCVSWQQITFDLL